MDAESEDYYNFYLLECMLKWSRTPPVHKVPGEQEVEPEENREPGEMDGPIIKKRGGFKMRYRSGSTDE